MSATRYSVVVAAVVRPPHILAVYNISASLSIPILKKIFNQELRQILQNNVFSPKQRINRMITLMYQTVLKWERTVCIVNRLKAR